MPYDQITAERVRDVLSSRRDVTEKRLMGGLCFMGGRRHVLLGQRKGRLLIRVGAAAHERMLDEPHVSAMKMGGRMVRGFVRVAAEGYCTDAALRKWIARGLDFVATLPAKPASARRGSKPRGVERKPGRRTGRKTGYKTGRT